MSSTPAKSDDSSLDIVQRVDQFMALFTRHGASLRGYVTSLVPNWADAEEILQDTHSILWKKFDQFSTGSDFFAWACQIARHEVMHYRRSKGRERVQFGDEFVEILAAEAVVIAEELDDLRDALMHCLGALSEKDRRLIEERYRDGATVRSVAELLGRSIDATYKALTRVRKALLSCMELQMNAEEST